MRFGFWSMVGGNKGDGHSIAVSGWRRRKDLHIHGRAVHSFVRVVVQRRLMHGERQQ